MVRRYALPCVAVAVVALAIAFAGSRHQGDTYRAGCAVRFSVPVTTATGTNYFDVQQTVAAGELARALRGPMFTNVAGATGMSPTALAAETLILPGPLDAYFSVTVNDHHPSRATDSASRLCAEMAVQLGNQRTAERTADAASVHDQLVSLEDNRASLATQPRTPAVAAQLGSLDSAISAGLRQYAVTLSLPDDYITSTRAGAAALVTTSTLRRNLIVAGGATPLAWFLLIMVAEAARRRRPLPEPPAVGSRPATPELQGPALH